MVWRIIFLLIAYSIILWLLKDFWFIWTLTKEQKYIWFWLFFFVSTFILQQSWYFKYKLKNKNELYKEKIEEISKSKTKLIWYKIEENLKWISIEFEIWWKKIYWFHNWEIKKLWKRDIKFSYNRLPILIQEWFQEAFIILESNNWIIFNIWNIWEYFNDKKIKLMYQKKILDYFLVEAYFHLLNNNDKYQLTDSELWTINNFMWKLDWYWNYNDWWEFINNEQRNMNLLDKMKEEK